MTEILDFWFPNNEYQKWWFIPYEGLDSMIYSRWYKVMKTIYEDNTIQYDDNNNNILIEHIILLDQFSRNINRIIPLDIISYTKKASILSHLWIEKNLHISQPIHYTVFALMPLRHLQQNDLVLEKLKEIENNNPTISNNKIYIRFKHTTIRKK